MELRRTANAGVLLKLENAMILLDGVCREVFPYLCTPSSLQEELLFAKPDVVAFTHHHKDHFDLGFARKYREKYGRTVMGTGEMARLYPNIVSREQAVAGENWKLSAFQTRHLGKGGFTTEHLSYVVEADHCIWFLGDASPVQMKLLDACPKPDVLIVPYAYLATPSAIQAVENLQPEKVVLVHMPLKQQDPEGLWQMIAPARERLKERLVIPELGQSVTV
jgi:L-ascorbate metabolism protein UlaG (beta-lactamase superfamily)